MYSIFIANKIRAKTPNSVAIIQKLLVTIDAVTNRTNPKIDQAPMNHVDAEGLTVIVQSIC